MHTHSLSGTIGLEVEGIDLNRPVSASEYEDLHGAFLQSNGVVVFRDQFLTPEAQHAFAGLWGEPIVLPHLAPHSFPGFPDVLRLTNLGKDNAVTENWHSDSIFLSNPPAITILAARDLPESGGDTMWANLYAAYDRLSSGMKKVLEGLRGKFVGTQPAPDTGESQEVFSLHHIVRQHPETLRKALLIGHPGDSVVAFDEMSPEESLPLLEFLYSHATQPDLIYRHHWRPGDVVMWDNRCTAHYAVHDYGEETRNLSRVTVTR
jgi:taurine dioxygenase